MVNRIRVGNVEVEGMVSMGELINIMIFLLNRDEVNKKSVESKLEKGYLG